MIFWALSWQKPPTLVYQPVVNFVQVYESFGARQEGLA